MKSDDSAREQRVSFLLEMYKQCSSHLNRHVSAMWQCVAVIAASAAALRVEQTSPMFDLGVCVAITLCAWLIASTFDACNWFNRNIAIISNIEKIFLDYEDLRKVHPYFHRGIVPGKIIGHFKVQLYLAYSVGAILLGGHFALRLAPGLFYEHYLIEPLRGAPYVVAVGAAIFIMKLRFKHVEHEKEFVQNSPGVEIKQHNKIFASSDLEKQ